jgi:hypothetical protein
MRFALPMNHLVQNIARLMSIKSNQQGNPFGSHCYLSPGPVPLRFVSNSFSELRLLYLVDLNCLNAYPFFYYFSTQTSCSSKTFSFLSSLSPLPSLPLLLGTLVPLIRTLQLRPTNGSHPCLQTVDPLAQRSMRSRITVTCTCRGTWKSLTSRN